MPFELQDDFGDDDALLNVDVDAMAAARRAAPPAGPGPRYGSAPPHAAPPPHARHPAQRMPYPHELPSAHQRGGHPLQAARGGIRSDNIEHAQLIARVTAENRSSRGPK